MPPEATAIRPTQSVVHPRLGEGVVVETVEHGFARVFFRDIGEQTVPVASLAPAATWNERVVANVRAATAAHWERLQLSLDAEELPLLASAASLTAAKVDLLPHQLVLTHRVAESPVRRLLVADDVGLGKTVEIALVLRELASRGLLTRALIVVPAGLVENWRRELNDVFHLDFEVFGAEGDVTDRKTNAFARHDRLIASIDTLKRPRRMARLEEAPAWDLVVFDEAHHLTAIRSGNSVKKTENYRLAELLRDRTRDLLLLSATPHQGDHFRFLMLVRLLHPTLFRDEADMLDHRYRLNTVVARRTKADACRTDGSPLFARRQVHTQVFNLDDQERAFYALLTDYIQDGYDLAAKQGGKGRALGFVMTVFQKIASSSFAAVRRTLERRLVALTLHEAIARDALLDVPGRDALLHEARAIIVATHGLADDMLGRAEADRLLAEARVQVLRKLRAHEEADEDASELAAASWEETAAMQVEYALPEERQRIRQLLDLYPAGAETKTRELLRAMEQLWAVNPAEKMIIFTTYLGSVDTLRAAIENRFPSAGVVVLKGGDQGAKLAAERRFRRPDGPRVLICTAAGREGINLQFARVLFNHDLPWNPMDLEQRIGRIHRYGQQDTAQVYNLVAGDTIEGRVYLLLEAKIAGIAKALGKVDERGEVAEDLRGQILGQLGERLSFNALYQEALRDPTLLRTAQELEVALSNATRAREVVGQLFQDLEPFRLDDYQPTDPAEGLNQLRAFVERAAAVFGFAFESLSGTMFRLARPGEPLTVFTTDREAALADEHIAMLGLEYPLIAELRLAAADLPADERGLLVAAVPGADVEIDTIWGVDVRGQSGTARRHLCKAQMRANGSLACMPYRRDGQEFFVDGRPTPVERDRHELVNERLPTAIRGYLSQAGLLNEGGTFGTRLLRWAERGISPSDAETETLCSA